MAGCCGGLPTCGHGSDRFRARSPSAGVEAASKAATGAAARDAAAREAGEDVAETAVTKAARVRGAAKAAASAESAGHGIRVRTNQDVSGSHGRRGSRECVRSES